MKLSYASLDSSPEWQFLKSEFKRIASEIEDDVMIRSKNGEAISHLMGFREALNSIEQLAKDMIERANEDAS